jgi:hypothetical protein
MAKPIKTTFKDAQFPPSGGSSDLECEGYGPSLIKGDLEVNGNKVVIGFGLHDEIQNVGS